MRVERVEGLPCGVMVAHRPLEARVQVRVLTGQWFDAAHHELMESRPNHPERTIVRESKDITVIYEYENNRS